MGVDAATTNQPTGRETALWETGRSSCLILIRSYHACIAILQKARLPTPKVGFKPCLCCICVSTRNGSSKVLGSDLHIQDTSAHLCAQLTSIHVIIGMFSGHDVCMGSPYITLIEAERDSNWRTSVAFCTLPPLYWG